ncbi:rod shape-determining protein RodA [Bacteroidota bacterium]
MKRKVNIWMNLDWFSILLYIIFIGIGLINIYSAVYDQEDHRFFDLSQRYGKQALWILGSLIIAFVLLLIESRFYSFFAYIIYAMVIVLLIAVLFVGEDIHGSRSWIKIGSFNLQPSEFAKFATALALAKLLSAYNFKINRIKNFLLIFLIIIIPPILILLENDTGSALVYSALIIVLFREGLSSTAVIIAILSIVLFVLTLFIDKIVIIMALIVIAWLIFSFISKNRNQSLIGVLVLTAITSSLYFLNTYMEFGLSVYFVILIGLGISSLYFLIAAYFKKLKSVPVILIILYITIGLTFLVNYGFNNILEEHQQHRINVFLGVDSDPLGIGYNVNQSKIAIGSGGLIGKGFLQGTQTKFHFVPEQSTDFIFCTIGEEWGFVGSFITIILYSVFLIRIISLAERQRSPFSRIFGYGIFSIFLFHITINLGMTIGLLPVIGIPLPFISYGGSSLWAFTMMLFVFLKLDASRKELF